MNLPQRSTYISGPDGDRSFNAAMSRYNAQQPPQSAIVQPTKQSMGVNTPAAPTPVPQNNNGMAGSAERDSGGSFYYDSSGTKQYSTKTPVTSGQSSYQDIGKAVDAADQKAAVNQFNLDIGTTPEDFKTFSDPTAATKALVQNEREQKALRELQLTQQEKDLNNNTDKATNEVKGNVDVTKGQLAGNREGFTSKSNEAAVGQQVTAADAQIGRLRDSRDTSLAAIAQARKDLEFATTSNNEALVKRYQATLDAASMKAKQADTEYINAQNTQQTQQMQTLKNLADIGVLTDATPEQVSGIAQKYGIDPTIVQAASSAASKAALSDSQKAQSERTTSAVDTFIKLNTAGVDITPEMISETSRTTGVKSEYLTAAAAGFNKTSQAIRDDKTLDAQAKDTALKKAKNELQDQIDGYTTSAGQNIKALTTMYNNKTDPKIIAAFKQAAGITDYSDPMTQWKLQQQIATTDEARLNAFTAAVDNGLDPGSFVSTKSLAGYKTTIDPETGKYNIQNAVDGTAGGQCGRFVNNVFGSNMMTDLYTEKQAKCDPSIGFGNGQTPPSSGMAFVMPITNSVNGHTGIYLSVDPKNNKNALVKDSNWGNDERIQTHSIPFSQITGYATPPGGQRVNGSIGSLTEKQILKNADAQGEKFKSPSDQNKYIAMVRRQGFLPGQKGGDEYDQIADDIMKPYSTLNIAQLPTDQRAGVEKALNKKRAEAVKNNDIVGLARASAGGKELDTTTLQKLEKTNMVVGELDDLSDLLTTEKTGPILGALRSKNPYDTKAVEIKALIQGLVPSLARGVYGEVGVLTDQDINNYIKTLPNLTSTDDQKKLLIDMTKKTLARTLQGTIKTQAMGGRDVSGFASLLSSEGVPQPAQAEKPKSLWEQAGDIFHNNFNSAKSGEDNPFNHIDTTSSEDILNKFN